MYSLQVCTTENAVGLYSVYWDYSDVEYTRCEICVKKESEFDKTYKGLHKDYLLRHLFYVFEDFEKHCSVHDLVDLITSQYYCRKMVYWDKQIESDYIKYVFRSKKR